jgi:hypothetical protein
MILMSKGLAWLEKQEVCVTWYKNQLTDNEYNYIVMR